MLSQDAHSTDGRSRRRRPEFVGGGVLLGSSSDSASRAESPADGRECCEELSGMRVRWRDGGVEGGWWVDG